MAMAAVQAAFIVGHYFVTPVESFKIGGYKVPGMGSANDRLLEKAKGIRDLTAALGCDVMWYYKEAILEYIDDNSETNDAGVDVIDCGLFSGAFDMFKDKRYTGQIKAKLNGIGIGGAKADTYTDMVQAYVRDLLSLVGHECTTTEEGDRMEVTKAKGIVEDLYGVFCSARSSEDMGELVEYSGRDNQYPFPMTRITEQVTPPKE